MTKNILIISTAILFGSICFAVAQNTDSLFTERKNQVQLIVADKSLLIHVDSALDQQIPVMEIPGTRAVNDQSAPRYTQLLRLMSWFADSADYAYRQEASEAMGRLAAYYYSPNKLQFDVLTGRHPGDIMEDILIRGLERLGTQGALPHLLYAYKTTKRPRLKKAIDDFDSRILEEELQNEQREIEEALQAEREAHRSEAKILAEKINNQDISAYELNEAMKRIGEMGEQQDVPVVIARLALDDVPSVVWQNGLRALGRCGGPSARDFLISELVKPMPQRGVTLDDYGNAQAIRRSQAALALGKCGDESTIQTLTNIANDDSQYDRVREACQKAKDLIRRRTTSKEE